MLEQVPTRGYLGLAAAGLACSLVTTAAVVAAPVAGVPEDYELDPDLQLAPSAVVEPEIVEPAVAPIETRDELPDRSLQLAFTFAGTRYLALADLDEETELAHGKLRRS